MAERGEIADIRARCEANGERAQAPQYARTRGPSHTPDPSNGTKRRATVVAAVVAVAGLLAAGASTYYSNLGDKAGAEEVRELEERTRALEQELTGVMVLLERIDARSERIEEALR